MLPIRGKAEGQRVLIHGGAGGVGSNAVQIAKAWGMHVTATCGTKNLDFVRQVCLRLILGSAQYEISLCIHAGIHSMHPSAANFTSKLCIQARPDLSMAMVNGIHLKETAAGSHGGIHFKVKFSPHTS